jgi:hypothetical protein
MNHLFSLNAEGGPLLCMDAGAAARWNGAEDGSRDYTDLCLVIDTQPEFSAKIMPISGVSSVVWEMQGAGIADAFVYTDGRIKIVRAWLSDGSNEEVMALADCAPVSRVQLGVIDVSSGVLALLWAPESGRKFPQHIDGPFRRICGTAIAGSAFAVNARKCSYSCWDERVNSGESKARILTLIPC